MASHGGAGLEPSAPIVARLCRVRAMLEHFGPVVDATPVGIQVMQIVEPVAVRIGTRSRKHLVPGFHGIRNTVIIRVLVQRIDDPIAVVVDRLVDVRAHLFTIRHPVSVGIGRKRVGTEVACLYAVGDPVAVRIREPRVSLIVVACSVPIGILGPVVKPIPVRVRALGIG